MSEVMSEPMTARPMSEGERAYRNVTAEAMLRHVRVVTKDNTVQLWLGATHIVNVEPDSIPAIALQAFAADQPHALSTSSAERGMREALRGFVEIFADGEEHGGGAHDDECDICLAIQKALAALSGIEPGEDEQARGQGRSAPISTDTKGTSK